ncbi:MAG TPA: hypothetical protein VL769_14540 [Acidimicrobiia bacterium]|nr:hypothetical protein [Acidimicrobiia bacterium]
MADLKTAITEIVTGLGMCGADDLVSALDVQPPALRNVDDATWQRLRDAWSSGTNRDLFVASWMNGRAFLHARDALRGRPPLVVEWKGPHRSIGDEAVPADLRVDHVYVVSCKYLSRIVVNASPEHLFDRLLKGGHGQRTGNDWYEEVAPAEHAALYAVVRDAVDLSLPESVAELSAAQRRDLGRSYERGSAWPGDGDALYAALVERVAAASAHRWRDAIGAKREAMLWRLLRIGSAPYFVLGASANGFMRLRIATPWDWRQHFELRKFSIEARAGGQPMIAWEAIVRRRSDGSEMPVRGYVEIRWSHRRFGAPPEAKVHLETPHSEVPGYFALD